MAEESEYYQYALLKHYHEPEIYNDEIEEEKYDNHGYVRLIISKLIEISDGDVRRLQAYMCLIAGCTLREAARECSISHEIVRIWREKIRYTHPELYDVMVTQKNKIESLIPKKNKEWLILNTKTNEVFYLDNLKKWCIQNGYKYYIVHKNFKRNKFWEHFEIYKL